jgi:hypothetical protein
LTAPERAAEKTDADALQESAGVLATRLRRDDRSADQLPEGL